MQTRVATDGQTMAGSAAVEGAPALPPRISWGAILAGGLVATTIDPAQPGETPSATLLGLAGGVWLLVANLIGLAVGGWVAARLSGLADKTDAELHGLSVWAISFLVSALLLGNIVAGTANTALRGASAVVGGAAQGIGEAAGPAARMLAPQMSGTLDAEALTERLRQGLEGGGDPAAMNPDARRAEMARILGQRLRQGDFLPGQRERLAGLAAAQYDLPPQEAQARIGQLEAEAQRIATQAGAEARAAADTAADAAATGAYWIFAAMILGAVAAVLGARIGTRRTVRRKATVTGEAYG
jgi:hypothetical protein